MGWGASQHRRDTQDRNSRSRECGLASVELLGHKREGPASDDDDEYLRRIEGSDRRSMTESEPRPRDLRTAGRLIEAQRQMLVDAGADGKLVRAFEAVVRHLFSLSEPQAVQFLRSPTARSAATARRLVDAPKMASLELDEVERLATDLGTPRTVLESIAVGRFKVPRGSLRSAGNSDQLREKILSMMRNERAHTTIAEVAKKTGR